MTVEVKSEEAQMAEPVVSQKEETVKAVEVIEKVAVVNAEEKPSKEPKSAEEENSKGTEEEENSSGPEVVVKKSSSFKEESNFLSDLKENERKALVEFKSKLQEAILENKLFKKEEGQEEQKAEKEKVEPEGEGEKEKPDVSNEEKAIEVVDREVSIWGIPLLPSKCSESTDVVLLKFLRGREFKVKEAFEMLQNALRWRKDSSIDSILDEAVLGEDLRAASYMDGVDREGHPICYNVYGVFQDDEIYQKTLGTEEKRDQFLRWRVQLMEKGIQKLDLKPGGVASLLQINDLKNLPGLLKKELRAATKQAVGLLQDNYPEFVARNIFINVPFWYYAFNAILSPFLTQRTKSKFVFARPAKVTETLLKYIPAEDIPIRYGGLKRENDTEFSVEDGSVSELIVKASSTEKIEIPAPEAGTTLLWDLTVLGWEVNYKEEFVPTNAGSYTVIVQKGKKMGSQEEPIRNSFKNNEPGKVVLTIENSTFKKKKVLFRYKTKSS